MPSRVVWSESLGRYRDARTGRLVAAATVRRDLDVAVQGASDRVSDLARRFQRREISLKTWELAMRDAIARQHLRASMAAKGGAAQMTPADYGRVGQRVRVQYDYLRQWARDVRAGRAPVDGRFVARAQLYAESARGGYQAVRSAELARRGFDEERNVLAASEHCEGDGSCVGETRRGWVARGALIPIGGRLCRTRCRCAIQYRSSTTGEIAA